jgi:hypothetical protein
MHFSPIIILLFALFIVVVLPATQSLEDSTCGCSEVTMCPPNSNTTGEGAASIEDCICYPGYVDVGPARVEIIGCPPNSNPVGEYALSLQDCVCDPGYVDILGSCTELFDCPPNSTAAAEYALSPQDCKCDPGYTRLFVNESCELLVTVPLQNSTAALSTEMIAGIAAAGSTVLAGGLWAVAKTFLVSPAIPAPVSMGNPAALKLRFFIEQV